MTSHPWDQVPLPLAPPHDFDDDYDDDADEEPSWWGTVRPPAPAWDVPAEPAARARTAADEVSAIAHVLRIRARLEPAEQHVFDALVCSDAAADIITMLVNRGEADAVACLRRRMADDPAKLDE